MLMILLEANIGNLLTLDSSPTSFEAKTSNCAAWPCACCRRVSISCAENFDAASEALTPVGNVINAFCSIAFVVALLIDDPSARFFGRPRSMIEASDSVRLCPGLVTVAKDDDSERPLVWFRGVGLGLRVTSGAFGAGDDRPWVFGDEVLLPGASFSGTKLAVDAEKSVSGVNGVNGVMVGTAEGKDEASAD